MGGVVKFQDRVEVEEVSEVRQVACPVKSFHLPSEQGHPFLIVSLPTWAKDCRLILVSLEARFELEISLSAAETFEQVKQR